MTALATTASRFATILATSRDARAVVADALAILAPVSDASADARDTLARVVEIMQGEAGDHDAALDLLAGMRADVRAYLVDEMGMEPDRMPDGSLALRHVGPAGLFVLVADADNGDAPCWADWEVGAYSGDDVTGTPIWSARSDGTADCLTLRQAVGMACAVVANHPDVIEDGGMFLVEAGTMSVGRTVMPPRFSTYEAAERYAEEQRGAHGVWAAVKQAGR